MNILALAAHGDDELLGPGGTLIRHARAGDAVHVAICVGRPNLKMYSEKRYGPQVLDRRKKQAEKVGRFLRFASVRCLDLQDEMLEQDLNATVTAVEKVVNEVKPDVVYLHHGGDVNQDHRGVFKAALVSVRGYRKPRIRRVLAFETLSTTEQAPAAPSWAFLPDYYVDISKFLDLKLKALRIYSDELAPFPHPRSAEGLTALARLRGATAGFRAAEAFALVRECVGD
ncbi:MAG: PIG-L family deacetylase [Elusimicrobia bacterium]|nr:PIG-L family deacetylase [Elusimicrobiota bacterium]